jgi:quercetin dioxygenase-like cupin family protein
MLPASTTACRELSHALAAPVKRARLTWPRAAVTVVPFEDHRRIAKEVAMPIPTMTGYANLKQLPAEQVGDKISRKILVGEQGMVVFWKMKAGARAAVHQHPHEQIFWMISGKMDFDLNGEKRTCVAGDVGVIPGNTPHGAYFPEDTEVIDVFAPPREDMFTGGDTYLGR